MAVHKVLVIHGAFKNTGTIVRIGIAKSLILLGMGTIMKSMSTECGADCIVRQVVVVPRLKLQPIICKRFSVNGKILIGER